MVNLARRVRGRHRAIEAPEHVDAVPDTALGSSLAGRLPLYWLIVAAVLAVGNALIPIWLAGSRLTGAARDGVQFNVLTLAIALALSAGIGVIWPRWWSRAMAILAVGPWPILLITSDNIAAGIATPLLIFLASWLGRQLTVRVLGELDLVSAWVIGATLGFGLIAAFGFVAGTLGILRPHTTWLSLGVIAVGLLIGARGRLRRDVREALAWLRQPVAPSPVIFLLVGLALACYWLNILGALAPEFQPDAVRQRLVAAAQFARDGNLAFTHDELTVAKDPALGEIAYAVAITIGSIQAAKLFHFTAGLLCAVAIFALASNLGSRFGGVLAAIAFYCTHQVTLLAQSAYLDLLPTLLALTAALILVVRPRLDWRAAALVGACVGLGVGVKVHFGYVAVGLAAMAGLIAVREGGIRRACQIVAIMTGVAILTVSPWMARAYAITGAIPGVALGATALSTGADGQAPLLFDLKGFGLGRSLWDLILLPITTTLASAFFGGDTLGGHTGYLLLGFFPLLVFIRKDRRAVALVVGAAAATVLWFYTAQYLRYGLPILALFLAATGVANARLQATLISPAQRKLGRVLVCILVLSGVCVRLQSADIAHRYTLGLQSREAFLSEYIAAYSLLEPLESQPGVARILTVFDMPRLYSTLEIKSTSYMANQFGTDDSGDVILRRLREGGYSHILLDRRLASFTALHWDSMTITNEDFLRRYTALVASDRYVYLYRILSPEETATARAWAQGRELLPNGGFEQAEAGRPAGWHLSGSPQYDQTGRASRTGEGAVRFSPTDNMSTVVAVQPGQAYLLAGANRGVDEPGIVELRVEWRDSNANVIAVGGEKIITSPLGYRAYSIRTIAPERATTAVVSVRGFNGQAWIDDLSLRSIASEGANITPATAATFAR